MKGRGGLLQIDAGAGNHHITSHHRQSRTRELNKIEKNEMRMNVIFHLKAVIIIIITILRTET